MSFGLYSAKGYQPPAPVAIQPAAVPGTPTLQVVRRSVARHHGTNRHRESRLAG